MAEQWTEEELLELARKYSFRSRLDRNTVAGPVLVWGRGSVVRDVNGKEYLDFNSGQMCAALGHNHPRITQALQESCETLVHSHMSIFNDREIVLASRLAEVAPPGMTKSMFLTSGSDSNEAAMTIAKRYTGGYEVASPMVSFHGLSDTARAVTFAGWRDSYGPFAPGNYAIFAPYRYRCSFCQEKPACDYTCLNASFDLLEAQADRQMAAVITEPLFSAGGVIDLPPGWLQELQRRCHERGMLLILDEAQTGLAKLGSMWASEQEGVTPDIFTISKHFGGGIAISAVVTTPEIEDRMAETGFVVGHSHSNDPLPCNAAIASIDIILEQNPDRGGPAHRRPLEGTPPVPGPASRDNRRHPGPGPVAGHRVGPRPGHPGAGLPGGSAHRGAVPGEGPDNEPAASRVGIPLRTSLHHHQRAVGPGRNNPGRSHQRSGVAGGAVPARRANRPAGNDWRKRGGRPMRGGPHSPVSFSGWTD